MDVVKNIVHLRKEKRLNQEDIAQVLGIDPSAVSKIESGNRQLKVDELDKIAQLLDVDLIYLFTYPKKFVDKDTFDIQEKVSVTFEVSADKRDYLLRLVNGEKKTAI